jgi:hypothetical protein
VSENLPFEVSTLSVNPTGISVESRSKFIRGTLLPLFESVTWPILATEVARQAAISQVRIDVGARMRGMWR